MNNEKYRCQSCGNMLKNINETKQYYCDSSSSVCIDSTARSAFELGYHVTILSDCTAGRTTFEQDYYCENIFPIYANVIDHKTFLSQIKP